MNDHKFWKTVIIAAVAVFSAIGTAVAELFSDDDSGGDYYD